MADLYALIVDGAIAKERMFDVAPDPNPVKGLDWRHYIKPPMPSYDGDAFHAPLPTDDIQPDQVVRTWGLPVAKTAEEIAQDVDAKKYAALAVTLGDYRVEKAIASTLFDVAVAAKSGNWTSFKLADGTPVTDRPTFYRYMKEKL